MPIIQINIWHCEICDETETTSMVTSVYTDETIMPPPAWANGIAWGDVDNPPDPFAGLLACPSCIEKRRKSPPVPPVVVGMNTLDLGAKIAG